MLGNTAFRLRLAVSIVAVLLAACGGDDGDTPTATPFGDGAEPTATERPMPDETALDGTAWLLAGINGADIDLQEPITLSFSEGQAGGFSGCNEYGSIYTASESGDFALPEIAQTDMACEAGMDLESDYLSALQEAARYEVIEGQRLELADAGGETLLVFTPDNREPLDGTSWLLVDLDGEPPISGTRLTLDLRAGEVSGSTGCNQYGGNYTANDRGDIALIELFWTERACPEPPGVMAQEQAFLAALADATSYQIGDTDSRLSLSDSEGRTRLVFERNPS